MPDNYNLPYHTDLLKHSYKSGVTPGRLGVVPDLYRCNQNTARNVRQRFVEQGFDAALNQKKRSDPPRQPILDGEKEARLIALACGKPPLGRSKWTLKLLAQELTALEIVESISDQTVRRRLNIMNLSTSAAVLGNPPKAECRFCRAHGRRA